MLRFPLAVLVVYIHSFGPVIDVGQLHSDGLTGMAVYDYLRIFISAVVARSAVPLFFLFSGFLLFKGVEKYDRKEYLNKLRKRWYSLARPYLIWNSLMLLLLGVTAVKGGGIMLHGKTWPSVSAFFDENGFLALLWNSSVWEERITWLGAQVHNSGPVLLSFWYMRDLIAMVILFPLVYFLIKRFRVSFILLLLAIYLSDVRIPFCSNTAASAALFFSIGAYFSIMKQDFTQVLWRWRYVICPLAVILIIVQTATGSVMGNYASQMVHLWLVVVQTFAFIVVASALCRNKRLFELSKKLASASFFIYAFHGFVLRYVLSSISKVTPMSGTWYMQCIDYLVAPLVCAALCVAVYTAGRRWMPQVMRAVVGERE